MTIFQYYKNDILITKPEGVVSIDNLIESIRIPKRSDIYEEIFRCEVEGDMARKSELKKKLFFIVPATTSNGKGRSYSNITSFTGVIQLDFDHIQNPCDFRDFLYAKYSFIIASWVSASKRGIKALVSIPKAKDVTEFKEYYWGITNEVMTQYEGFDTATQNSVLPMFLSYDSDIKYRKEYTTWTTKGINPNEIKPNVEVPDNLVITPTTANRVVDNVTKSISSIVSNGHPQVRAAFFSLGGYIGAGYISIQDAYSMVEYLIPNNSYLNKDVEGYKRTAYRMIDKGIINPLYL